MKTHPALDTVDVAELARERHAGPPSPPRIGAEPEAVKRQRLLDLDEELNQARRSPHVAEQLGYAESLRGRICDLPGQHLDFIAERQRTSRLPKALRDAQHQINASARLRAPGGRRR